MNEIMRMENQLLTGERRINLAEAPSERIANCPNPDCKSPILSNHPYPWCAECGERFPEDIQARLSRVQETRTKAAVAMADLQRSAAAQPIEILGRPLQCVVCRHNRFFRQEKEIDLATALTAPFFGASVANSSGTYLLCAACGYVHWFHW